MSAHYMLAEHKTLTRLSTFASKTPATAGVLLANVESRVKFVGALLTDKYEVVKIKYFTARVAKNDDDPDMAIKQQQYLEALKSLEKVEVIEGVYKRFRVKLPFAKEPCRSCDKVQYATVVKTEEKMSDVNLVSGSKASGCNGEDGIRGLHGFSGRCIKNMRLLCKAWYIKFR